MFDVDYAFLAIVVVAFAVSGVASRQFTSPWAGVLVGIFAGIVVSGLLLPFWVYFTVSFDGMFMGLEGIPD